MRRATWILHGTALKCQSKRPLLSQRARRHLFFLPIKSIEQKHPVNRYAFSPARHWLRALGALAFLGAGSLFAPACYLLHAPDRDEPALSAGIYSDHIRLGNDERSYLLYVPERRLPAAPLVILLHGSKQTGEDLREATDFAFDRLADEHGFVAVYPDGYGRRWNDCRAAGRYKARRRHIDDVEFMLQLIAKLRTTASIDPARVFLVGYSSGGQLAFRMALEEPGSIAAIAAFSANLPTPENLACTPLGRPVPLMLVNGTHDRINPFVGGEVTVFGFASRGNVLSSQASAEYFAHLAGLTHPVRRIVGESAETWVEELRWYEAGVPEVMLVAVHGGGHVVPGPNAAFPRILGKVSPAFDGPGEVLRFFSRQPSSRAR